jgi:HK97 family phage portal protein
MSLLFKHRDLAAVEIVERSRGLVAGTANVNAENAMRHSAVWACLRLRADLISTMPVDVFRRSGGVQVEVTKPSLLVTPDGVSDVTEWLYSSQVDLDRYGNAYGVITAKDAAGKPMKVDLVSAGEVSVRAKGSTITKYRIGRTEYDPSMVWHERQFTVAGLPVGLSPISYAAMSIGGYLSAQQFALDWFTNGAGPSGHLQNTQKTVAPGEATTVKERFKAAILNRDVFVSGSDWTYNPLVAAANDAAFLDEMKFGVADVCRFFGVPGDMIDAESSSGSITYANVTQRNLQLLILNLGPAITRREKALSAALPAPRYVKFNTDALLRMDPSGRAAVIKQAIDGRWLTPDEARELEDRQPLTPEQESQFDRLFGSRTQAQAPTTGVKP